jgi:hypothetical protein
MFRARPTGNTTAGVFCQQCGTAYIIKFPASGSNFSLFMMNYRILYVPVRPKAEVWENVSCRVADPDPNPNWILIQSSQKIRIWIRNPDPYPGG